MTTRRGRIALAALGAGAAVVIVVELALGAISFGQAKLADPCTSRPAFKGGGIDGAVQRFALAGLDGAACKLGTTREELVLSFVPSAQTKRIRWSHETIDRALRAGLDRAAQDTTGGGIGGAILSYLLRKIVADPLGYLLGQGG